MKEYGVEWYLIDRYTDLKKYTRFQYKARYNPTGEVFDRELAIRGGKLEMLTLLNGWNHFAPEWTYYL